MALIAEIIGLLAVGSAFGVFVRVPPSGSTRAAGVAVAVVAVASLLFFQNSWSTISAYPAATRAAGAIPKQAAETAPGATTNVGFLTWARAKMAAGTGAASFALMPATILSDAFNYQWSTYLLLPGYETDDLRYANWIVLYDVDPRKVQYDKAEFDRLIVYSPGFALAQRTHVG
jgi:hypothetical protein